MFAKIFTCLIVAVFLNFGSTISDFKYEITSSTTRGLVIDAGSGGSRIHIFHWSPRVFHAVPPDITFPRTDEVLKGKISPAIATLSDPGRLFQF